MKSGLQLKLSQHFTLTPQLQQSIKLLQLSTIELNQEVEKALAENIFLEREEPSPKASSIATAESVLRADESRAARADANLVENRYESMIGVAPSYAAAHDDDEHDFLGSRFPDSPTLREHLQQQLSVLNLSTRDHQLALVIVEMIDENGYLQATLEEIMLWLPIDLGVSMDELRIALKRVQALDPAGIGARSVSECLLRQLETAPNDAARALAIAIVSDHLDALAAHDFNQLKKVLACGEDELRAAYRLIQTLTPKPGAKFSRDETRYVAPDVIVKKTKSGWITRLNSEVIPRVRLNNSYVDIIKSSAHASRFSTQMQEARWMIKNIQQRLDTILRVSQAIVERQHNFLDHGEIAMRPLVLREIADQLSLHESTVSRVTTQKFMLTPRGTYELKYFFGSHVSTETGGTCSATAIRAMIKQLVSSEDATKPISDNDISKILGDQGIVVARRTVAKYRESMNIAAVNLRRAI
jgi:RNA polymerase sigma-54 factor